MHHINKLILLPLGSLVKIRVFERKVIHYTLYMEDAQMDEDSSQGHHKVIQAKGWSGLYLRDGFDDFLKVEELMGSDQNQSSIYCVKYINRLPVSICFQYTKK